MHSQGCACSAHAQALLLLRCVASPWHTHMNPPAARGDATLTTHNPDQDLRGSTYLIFSATSLPAAIFRTPRMTEAPFSAEGASTHVKLRLYYPGALASWQAFNLGARPHPQQAADPSGAAGIQ